MMPKHAGSSARPLVQQGRTLIELLIAMVLSLMIVAAVGVLYSASSNSSRTAQQLGSTEEAGQLALYFLGEPLMLASYGNINTAEFSRSRYQASSFQGVHLRACSSGRFKDVAAGDFTCEPTAAPGDQLYIAYQTESAVGPPQGINDTTDCLGQDPGATVVNIYSVEMSPSTVPEFTCLGSGSATPQALVRNAEDFKVYFAMDNLSHAMVEAGGMPHSFNPSSVMTAAQINALPGANDPPTSAGNPWNHVIAVYACIQVATAEAGTTPEATSTFIPCPQDENEAVTGAAPVTVTDGIARRSHMQIYTIRARAQPAAGSQRVL